MSRYNDNNPQHRKELLEYLTRPKADSKGAFRTFVQDNKINPFEQKIVNKTKELGEDKITTKQRPVVKDHFTKQLINAHNKFDGGPYIVDNETGEVVSETALKRRFSYQDKPYP